MATGGLHPWPCEDSGALPEKLQGYLNAGGSQVGVDGHIHRGGDFLSFSHSIDDLQAVKLKEAEIIPMLSCSELIIF